LCACFKLGDPLVSGGNAPTDRGDDVTVYFFREPNDQEWKALAAIVEEYHRGDVRIGKTIIVDGKPVVGMKGSELGVINDDHVRQLDTKLSVIADKELVRLIHEDLYVRVDQKTGESNGYAMSEGGYYALKEALSWIGIKINYKVTEGFALVFDRELWTDEAMSVENLDHIQKILRDIGKDLFALEVSSLPLSDNQVSQLISDRGVLEGLKMQGAGHHQEFPWGETINQSITKLLNRIEALESKKSKIEDLVGQDQKGRDFAMNAQRPVGGAMMTKEGIKGMFDGYEMVGLDGKPYHMTYAGEFENEIKFLINGGEAGEIEFAVEDGYFVSIPWVASYGRKQGLFTKILEKLYSVMPVGPRIRGTHLANEATLRQMVEAILTVGEKQSGGSFDDLMRTQSGLKEIIPTSRVKADLKQDLRAIKDDREFNQFFVDLRKYIYQYWKLSQQDRTNKLPKVETLFLNTKPVASAFINAGFSNIELHLKLETDEKDVDFDFSFEKSDKALTAGSRTGGIDLTSANVNIQGNSLGIKFHLDPSQLQQLQNASGFVPVIISVRPVVDLRKFLGVT